MAKRGLQLETLVVPIVPDIARYKKELQKIVPITTKVGKQNEAAIKKYFVNPLNMVGQASRKNFSQIGRDATMAGRKIQQAGQMGAQSLRQMNSAMKASQRDMRRLKAEVNSLTQRLKALERQAKRTGKAVKQSGVNRKQQSGLMNAGFALGMAGVGLTSGVTAPIAGAAGFGLKQMIEAESSFAGVAKTVNGTEKQLEGLRKGFRDMALEIPIGVNELNRIGEAAGQLGIRTESILEFSKVMAKLGVTTNMSSDEAATSLARFANITQMSQQDFGALGSTIVHLGNQFATTEREIVDMGLRIAGAGHQVGMTEGQILALATAASSLGLEVEMGGTAVSRLIIRMQAATSAAQGNATAFSQVAGMTGQAFQTLVKNNPAEAFRQFIVGLGRTKKAGGDVIGVLEEMGIDEVRLRDTILRLASGSDVLTRALQEQHEGWFQVDSLTTEAEKRFATTESQLQLLWNAVVEVGIQLGEALAPALKTVVEWARQLIPHFEMLIDYFTSLPGGVQTTVIVMAGFAALLGPMTIALSGLILTIGAFAFAFETLGTSIGGVAAGAIALAPALLAVAGAAVAFGPLIFQLHSLNMELKESLALSGKMNQLEQARHQKVIDEAMGMDPKKRVQFLASQLKEAERDLPGRQMRTEEAKNKAAKFEAESRARTFHGGIATIDQPQAKILKQKAQEEQDALGVQEDWVKQLRRQLDVAKRQGAIPGIAPGVMGGADIAKPEKTPIEKAREQLQKQQESAAAMEQARAEAGLPPLHPPKLEGIDAVREQVQKEQERKAMRDQVMQEMGLAKPEKLTGVAAQEAFLQNKMQREADRATAMENLGIPKGPGPRVRSASRRRGGIAVPGLGGAGHVSKRAISPYAAMKAHEAARKSKVHRRVSGAFHAMGPGAAGAEFHGPGGVSLPTSADPGVAAIRQARSMRAAEKTGFKMSDFTQRKAMAKAQAKPMVEAIAKGNMAAEEKKREAPAYEDSEKGYLMRIADNTTGLRNKTILVAPVNLRGM